MIRTQIQLAEEQATILKRRARHDGISMAQAIKCAVDMYIAQAPDDEATKREKALAAIGAFSAEPRLSQQHDAVAFEQEDDR